MTRLSTLSANWISHLWLCCFLCMAPLLTSIQCVRQTFHFFACINFEIATWLNSSNRKHSNKSNSSQIIRNIFVAMQMYGAYAIFNFQNWLSARSYYIAPFGPFQCCDWKINYIRECMSHINAICVETIAIHSFDV